MILSGLGGRKLLGSALGRVILVRISVVPHRRHMFLVWDSVVPHFADSDSSNTAHLIRIPVVPHMREVRAKSEICPCLASGCTARATRPADRLWRVRQHSHRTGYPYLSNRSSPVGFSAGLGRAAVRPRLMRPRGRHSTGTQPFPSLG